MKRSHLAFILVSAWLMYCAPTSYITGSWKNPKNSKAFHKVLVAGLTNNTVMRSTIENAVASALQKRGLGVVKGLEIFPPSLGRDSISRQALDEGLKRSGCEAVLTISLQKKETETQYTGGGYMPSRWSYYNSFWGYYDYWYPYGYSPGYYTNEDVYYFESNLYDEQSDQLVWSAQSRTYGYDGVLDRSQEFGSTVVTAMLQEGVIK